MIIYIAGKITGLTPSEVELKFQRSEAIIMKLGHVSVNPAKIVPWSATYKEAMKICVPLLMTCDAIYLQSDWEISKGARLEARIAKTVGLPVLMESKILKSDVKKFKEIRDKYSPAKTELITKVLDIVCQVTNVKKEKLLAVTRGTRDASDARHLFCKTVYPMGFTLQQIGHFLNRDHSTILMSVLKADDLMKYSEKMRLDYQAIREAVSKELREKSYAA